ncbi:MAG: PAS domain S-box protein [Ignavibacteria bacterium]|nr:PAS domain S-box protein [Ignavibacteria bacterium]
MSNNENWQDLRNKIIGFGELSTRKNYYPELQKKLDESERFKKLLEEIDYGIIQVEQKTGTIKEINSAAAVIFRRSVEELSGSDIRDSLPDELQLPVQDLLGLSGKINNYIVESTIDAGKQSKVCYEWSLQIVHFSGEAYLVIVIKDRTSQKRAEEQLRANATWLTILFERSPIGILVTNKQRIIIDTNPSFARMLGYEREDLIGKDVAIIHISEQSYIQFGQMHYEAIRKGEQARLEYKLRHKLGGIIWVNAEGQAIKPGELDEGTIWQAQDITEKKMYQFEQQMVNERQERYSQIFKELIDRRVFYSEDMIEEFRNINEVAGKLGQIDFVGIWLFTQDYSELRCYDLYEYKKDLHNTGIVFHTEGLVHYLDKLKTITMWFDANHTDELLNEIKKDIIVMNGITAGIYVPVWVRGNIRALFIIESGKQGYVWLPEERQLAQTMAGYVANCLETWERRQIESALRNSEERLRSFIREMHEGITIINESAIIEEWNPMAENITGVPASYAIGKYWSDIAVLGIPDNQNARMGLRELELNIINAARNGTTEVKHAQEYLLIHANGSQRYVQQSIFPLKTSEGIKIAGVFTDVTQRRLAEDALRESEDKFRSITEQITDAIFVANEFGEITYISPVIKEILQYTAEEMTGRSIARFLDEEEVEDVLAALDSTLHGDTVLRNMEILLRRRDSSKFYAELSATRYVSQKTIGTIGVIRDISQRKTAEEMIRKLSIGIEQSSVMIMITDIEGNIEYVNPRFSAVTGFSRDEIIGKNPRILQSGKTTKEEYRHLWKQLVGGKEWRGEFLNRKKNGELFWEEDLIYPIFNQHGTIINYIGIKEDITEKKHMIEEVIAARDKAEELNRVKSSFLANMSHELRTPLIGILGYAEILQEEVENDTLRKRAAIIFKNGNRLLETLNMILNLSKIEADIHEMRREEVDILAVVQEVIELFKETASKRALQLESSSDIEEATAYLDRRLLLQTMNNLVNNALKFTSEGGVAIKVQADFSDSQKWVIISVEDTGIGISKENQSLIWEEFRQVSEGHGRTYEGTGLGLTITKRFVEKMDGSMNLLSEPGKGSTFTIRFPAIKLIRAGVYL